MTWRKGRFAFCLFVLAAACQAAALGNGGIAALNGVSHRLQSSSNH
jgi:hypothetical protein